MLTALLHFWWLRSLYTQLSFRIRNCRILGHRNTSRQYFLLRKTTPCLKPVWNRTPLALRPSLLCGRIRCCVWQCGRRWWRCLREEWNHLSRNNKKEDARLVTIIDLFAHRVVTVKQTRGRSVKSRLTGTKGRHLRCSNAFRALRSKFSWSFMFFPLASLRFSFYCWISDTWRGEVKTHSFASRFGGSCMNSTGFIDTHTLTPAIFEKFLGMCG